MPSTRVILAGLNSRNGSEIPQEIGGNDSYTKLLLHCEGISNTFVDDSSVENTVLATDGMTQSKANKRFGTKSAYFDGNQNYISLELGLLNFSFDADEEFCMDFWINFNQSYSERDQFILAKGDYATLGYALYYTSSNSKLNLVVNGNNILNFTWEFQVSSWYHIALLGTGTNLKIYIGGIEKGSCEQVALS